MTIIPRSDLRQRSLELTRNIFRLFLCLNLLITLFSLAIPSFTAEAGLITVNTTDDELNSDGDCSLREAIQAANTDSAVDACTAGIPDETDEISLPAGTYTLSIPRIGDENANVNGDLDILDDLGISGASMEETIIEGGTGWDDRILDVPASVSLSLSDLTLRNGDVTGDGGGLRHSGETLAMYGVGIHDNQATGNGGGIYLDAAIASYIGDSSIHDNSCTDPGCDGGGIYMLSEITLSAVEVYQNSAQGDGGGIHNGADGPRLSIYESTIDSNQATLGGGIYTGNFYIQDSTISSNSAIRTPGGAGGGMYYTGSYISVVSLFNVTVSSNQANGSGGGLWLGGSGFVQINNVTVTANEAKADATGSDYGGGMYFNASPSNFRVANSIFAQNLLSGVINADHADCTNAGGSLDTLGHNLQGLQSSTLDCDFSYTGDKQGEIGDVIDALLGPLQDNGGPTHTHALLLTSEAIEFGNPIAPGAGFPACESEDQRGVSRPQGTFCDIGAFERGPNTAPITPSNPDPGDTDTDVSIYTDLSWDGGDPDGDPVTYDVYFEAEDATPDVLTCDDASSSSCDPGILLSGTTYYWYVEANDSEDTTAGPIWSFTTSASTPVELLLNTDLEIVVPSPWKGSNLETVDGSDCGTAHGGSCSAALTGTSGPTKMLFYGLPGFSGSAGDTFNLSYYNRRQDVGGAGAVQVRVSIRYTDATMGHFSFVPGVGTADWALYSHDFTAAKNYDWGVVRLIFSKPNGTLWYDDMSLMRDGSEELLDNGDMEIRVPSMWKGAKLTTSDGSDCYVFHSGNCSAALTGSTGLTKMLFYGIPGFSGSAGDSFKLSYYNMRQDVGGAGAVQVRVSIRYTDMTMGHFSFVPGVGTAPWALYEHYFTAAKAYDWGVVRLIFSKPNGTLWYDDMSLMR